MTGDRNCSRKQIRLSQLSDPYDIRRLANDTLASGDAIKDRVEVSWFDARSYDAEEQHARIGKGALGGLEWGLAQFDEVLERFRRLVLLQDVNIHLPKMVTIGGLVHERFMQENDLHEFAVRETDDEAVLAMFAAAELPLDILYELREILQHVRYPLAVRPSPIQMWEAFAGSSGGYSAFMLPNTDPDPEQRMYQLITALKHVYASLYFQRVKQGYSGSPYRVEDERLTAVLQEVIGDKYSGGLMYPNVSGVAFSLNPYERETDSRKAGLAYFALGFAKIIYEAAGGLPIALADTGRNRRQSLRDPVQVISQQQFWALDLGRVIDLSRPIPDSNLVLYDCATAAEAGAIQNEAMGSDSDQNHSYNTNRDDSRDPEIALDRLRSENDLAVTQAIILTLELARIAMSSEVEIEFSVRFPDDSDDPIDLWILQMRPLRVPALH